MKGSNKRSHSYKGNKYEKQGTYIAPTKHYSLNISKQNQWYVYIPYHITIYWGHIISKGCNEMT